MLNFDNMTRNKQFPWLIIAIVLFCAVASYYFVHYTIFKTFSIKVVKFDNLYVEGLTKANHNLKAIQNELHGIQAKACSAEVLQVLTEHILTSNEQDLVWVKYLSESVICSAIGTTQIYGPKYVKETLNPFNLNTA